MTGHPIEALMTTAMESIRDMVDVNTIVGDAVQAPDGTVIIPISRVAFGFAAGGGEYSPTSLKDTENDEEGGGKKSANFPFAGGSGAGVNINPVAFMVVGNGQIKLLPVNVNSSVDKILELVPDLWDRVNETVKRKINVKKEIKAKDTDEKNGKKIEVD